MGYLPIESNVVQAVTQVRDLYHKNGWDFSLCVSTVANRFGFSFEYLISQYRRSGGSVRKRKLRSPEKAYNGKTPYWVEN